jgi:hypothetical protein
MLVLLLPVATARRLGRRLRTRGGERTRP